MTALPETLPPVPAPTALPSHAASGHGREEREGRLRLYVWQVPVRATHWVTAVCIVVLSLTGGYIADPFLIPPGGGVMHNVRLIHMIAAFTLLVSGMIRVVYLIVGNRFARWSAFIPTSWFQTTELFRQAAFYGFLTRHHPKVLGHNQLAASAYLVLWTLLLVETVTGFALDGLIGAEPGATGFWWVRELFGPQLLRLIHHFCMWAILAIALFHIYSCVLIDHIERNGLVSSIVNGYKFVSREEIEESRDGGIDLLAEVTGEPVAAEEATEHAEEEAAEEAADEAGAVAPVEPSNEAPVGAPGATGRGPDA